MTQQPLKQTAPTPTTAAAPAGVSGPGAEYCTAQVLWRAAGDAFDGWERGPGTTRTSQGCLSLDPEAAETASDLAGAYQERSYHNGGSYRWGEVTSPLTPAGFATTRAVPSWNVATPPGTWVEVLVRVQLAGGRLTRWYSAGVWAADGFTVSRHSVSDQGDGDATMTTDTLAISDGKPAAEAVQVKVRLMSARPGTAPVLRMAAVAVSTTPLEAPAGKGPPAPATPGDPARWGRVLDVPAWSQWYPDGEPGWCSPTSMAMVVAYWSRYRGPAEGRVRATVDGVYDWVYDGHGNWPFNTAYAATRGLEASVARFASLAETEAWIAAGVPVAMSYGWKPGQLSGAPIESSEGHLGVLVGFDRNGDPVLNDPAGRDDGAGRRTYRRDELEHLWLTHSGGTVYLAYPPGWLTPSR